LFGCRRYTRNLGRNTLADSLGTGVGHDYAQLAKSFATPAIPHCLHSLRWRSH
jgi:hypothetical protein